MAGSMQTSKSGLAETYCEIKSLEWLLRRCISILRERDIWRFRYQSQEDQAILLECIAHELEKNPEIVLPEELWMKLSNPQSLATTDIRDLCDVYRDVVRLVVLSENQHTEEV